MPDQPDAMLVVERGIPEVSVIPLDQSRLVLGKTPDADIIIDNPYVSRRHARITLDIKQCEIQDLGSKNGTFVNGVRLKGDTQRLHSGDRVELGRGQVVLKFQEWGSTVTLPPEQVTVVDALSVDTRAREVRLQGTRLDPPFSRKEFDVLSLLFRRRGEACSKDEIAAAVWPERTDGDVADQDIEQCVRRLRLRIEPEHSHPRYIVTVRGFGYRLS